MLFYTSAYFIQSNSNFRQYRVQSKHNYLDYFSLILALNKGLLKKVVLLVWNLTPDQPRLEQKAVLPQDLDITTLDSFHPAVIFRYYKSFGDLEIL